MFKAAVMMLPVHVLCLMLLFVPATRVDAADVVVKSEVISDRENSTKNLNTTVTMPISGIKHGPAYDNLSTKYKQLYDIIYSAGQYKYSSRSGKEILYKTNMQMDFKELDALFNTDIDGGLTLYNDELVEMISSDHPEEIQYSYDVGEHLSYINLYSDTNDNTVYISFIYDLNTIKQMNEAVEKSADQIISTLTNQNMISTATEDQKALTAKNVFEYCSKNIEYDGSKTAANNRNAYGGLVNKKAVCAGIAGSYSYLLKKIGIPVVRVGGVAPNSEGNPEGHEWTVVKLGDQWYEADPTWGIEYFGHTTADFEKKLNHKRNAYSSGCTPPVANGTKYTLEYINKINDELSKKAVKSISLNKKSLNLVKNKTFTLKATITPSDGTDATLTWKSSNKKVATVNSKGVVKAVRPGKATITVTTANGKRATCKVTVSVKLKSFKFARKSYSVRKGKTITPKLTFSPKDATNKEVTYKSSNTKVAVVNKNGKITAKKRGKVKITATSKENKKLKAECEVIVK